MSKFKELAEGLIKEFIETKKPSPGLLFRVKYGEDENGDFYVEAIYGEAVYGDGECIEDGDLVIAILHYCDFLKNISNNYLVESNVVLEENGSLTIVNLGE